MVKLSWWWLLAILLLACSDVATAPPAEPCDAAVTVVVVEEPPLLEAGAPDATDAAPPCRLRVESVEPRQIPAGTAGALVEIRGCGLSAVREVRVRWELRPFIAIDDGRLVFASGVVPAGETLPFLAQVDVIAPSVQTQAFVRFEAAQ